MFPFIPFSPAEIAGLKEAAEKRRILNKKTMLAGAGNVTGFAGELAFKKWATGRGLNPLDAGGCRDYDVTVSGWGRVEVKSRKARALPQVFWDCKIPEYSFQRQRCDYYVFTVVPPDIRGGWILGKIEKSIFSRIAVPLAGDATGKVYSEPHLAVRVAQLTPCQ